MSEFPTPTVVATSDVEQLAVARHCRNFVVSVSTFHLWMAYMAIRPRHIIAMNDTAQGLGVHRPPWQRDWIML